MKIWIGYWADEISKSIIKINKFEINGKVIEISGQDSYGNFNMTGGIEEGIFDALQYYSDGRIFNYKGLFDQENCLISGLWTNFESQSEFGYFELRQIEENLARIYKLSEKD